MMAEWLLQCPVVELNGDRFRSARTHKCPHRRNRADPDANFVAHHVEYLYGTSRWFPPQLELSTAGAVSGDQF